MDEPSFLSHRTMVPSLIVGESEGILSGVEAKGKGCHGNFDRENEGYFL